MRNNDPDPKAWFSEPIESIRIHAGNQSLSIEEARELHDQLGEAIEQAEENTIQCGYCETELTEDELHDTPDGEQCPVCGNMGFGTVG